MSMDDESLFEKVLRVETKDIFVDLKKNRNGMYLKISERNGTTRNTVLIPASGLERLKSVLDEAMTCAKDKGLSIRVRKPHAVDPEVRVRSVYVSGLAWTTTNDNLLQHMSVAGPCLKATVLRVKNKRSLGCGVVEYDSHDTAVHAVTVLNDSELDGRKIHCREDRDLNQADIIEDDIEGDEPLAMTDAIKDTVTSKNIPPSKLSGDRVLDEFKVFCTNLSWETNAQDLTEHMSAVGDVINAEVFIRNGRSQGCGVVEFSDSTAVLSAIAQFNGQDFKGRIIVVREYYQ
eukprot:gene5935-11972_t